MNKRKIKTINSLTMCSRSKYGNHENQKVNEAGAKLNTFTNLMIKSEIKETSSI